MAKRFRERPKRKEKVIDDTTLCVYCGARLNEHNIKPHGLNKFCSEECYEHWGCTPYRDIVLTNKSKKQFKE